MRRFGNWRQSRATAATERPEQLRFALHVHESKTTGYALHHGPLVVDCASRKPSIRSEPSSYTSTTAYPFSSRPEPSTIGANHAIVDAAESWWSSSGANGPEIRPAQSAADGSRIRRTSAEFIDRKIAPEAPAQSFLSKSTRLRERTRSWACHWPQDRCAITPVRFRNERVGPARNSYRTVGDAVGPVARVQHDKVEPALVERVKRLGHAAIVDELFLVSVHT